MANKQDHIARLQVAVSHLHNCGAIHRSTVPLYEVFNWQSVWQEDVEVFDLHNQPKAKRAYAWSHLDGKKDERERFIAFLEILPVDLAQKVVQVQSGKYVKGKK